MNEHEASNALDELAGRHAIAFDYVDIFGQRHTTSNETKRAILTAMGLRVGSEEDARQELSRLERVLWERVSDPVLVVREGADRRGWSFRMPATEDEESEVRIVWQARDEAGVIRAEAAVGPGLPAGESRVVGGARYARFEVPSPPDLPIGYYDVTARASSPTRQVEGTVRLIVTPARCYLPEEFERGDRVWGIAAQLYSLRSERNWGAGDFTDLTDFLHWAADDLGAGLIGLNPLHALRNVRPYHISPYSPDSRLFVNVLYVDVERVPEYHESRKAQDMRRQAGFRAMLDELRASELVEYDRVYAAKRAMLEVLFEDFAAAHLTGHEDGLCAKTARGHAFMDFVREEGEPLERYAVFQALSEQFHGDSSHWREWPEQYQHPRSPAVATFQRAHQKQVRFHQYLQWVAAEQIDMAVGLSRELGMAIGLYHDLALGSDRAGSDAWVFQDLLALDADCGAPPDALGPEGQNWGLPPVNPSRLREDGYRMFSEMLRRNLRRGGALRMDHVMALFRLFWIPRGMPAAAGTYVAYPAEDLLGIVALESVRHRAVVIGEDLGTVPDYVREKLGAARVLSYRVSYFERRDDGEWKAPSAYPAQAVAVVSTHDLPTLTGFWAGEDIRTRERLGFYREESALRAAWEERQRDKERIVRALRAEGVLPHDDPTHWTATPDLPADVWQALHLFLARTPAWLMLAGVEDLVGERAQINLPGTVENHPNWSRKIRLTLEELKRDPAPRDLAAVINRLRGPRFRRTPEGAPR